MKLFRRFLLLGSLCIGPAAAALAQQGGATATQAPATAREVIDRYVEVTNSAWMVEHTSSKHVIAKLSMPMMGIEGKVETWNAKPDSYVMLADLGDIAQERQGYDGKTGWAFRTMMGPALLEGPELLQAKSAAQYDNELRMPDDYESIELEGKEKFADKDCYKLKLVLKPLAGMDAAQSLDVRTMHEYYDVESGLLLGSSSLGASPMGPLPMKSFTGDYRKFGETLMATRMEQEQMGQKIVLTIESVEFDTVKPETFALPEEIQTLLQAKAQEEKPKPQ